MSRSLAVIIPAYNEQPRLQKTLDRVREYFSSTDYDWSVCVVSDGSTDDTAAIVKAMHESDARFKLIEYRPNRGKGYAVRTGMLEADADWLLLCDADLATPIEEIELLAAANADVAIGSRALDRSKLEVHQPFLREFGGRVLNKIIQLLAVRGLRDTQCGFKLFSRKAAKDAFSRCRLDGFSYDVEALMFANALGYKIKEVSVRWAHQEGSKVKVSRDAPRMLWDLIKLRFSFKKRMAERA
ncbi:MAG: dolichyl-phosphate beta-glucosyltransferase [Fimbriimonadales bacterium]